MVSMNGKHDKWVIQYMGLDGNWRTLAAAFRTRSLAEIEMAKMNRSDAKIGEGYYRVRQRR
jgi:hypothetical protein